MIWHLRGLGYYVFAKNQVSVNVLVKGERRGMHKLFRWAGLKPMSSSVPQLECQQHVYPPHSRAAGAGPAAECKAVAKVGSSPLKSFLPPLFPLGFLLTLLQAQEKLLVVPSAYAPLVVSGYRRHPVPCPKWLYCHCAVLQLSLSITDLSLLMLGVSLSVVTLAKMVFISPCPCQSLVHWILCLRSKMGLVPVGHLEPDMLGALREERK